MLSIVVSSIVLSIGLSLFNIVQKELILSGTGRDSQFAFYSADGGVECAMYWDIGRPDVSVFPESAIEWRGAYNDGDPPSTGTMCGETDLGSAAQWHATVADCPPEGGCRIYDPGNPGGDPSVPPSGYEDDIVTIDFHVKFQDPVADSSPGSCAKVNVTKTGNGQTGSSYKVTTKIESKGYNDECTLDNPALVERAISVTY